MTFQHKDLSLVKGLNKLIWKLPKIAPYWNPDIHSIARFIVSELADIDIDVSWNKDMECFEVK